MPISEYFKGHGSEVLHNMQEEYGAGKGKQVFYATANKHNEKPVDDAEEYPQAEADRLYAAERAAAEKLKKLGAGTGQLGLTPDDIKFSSEFRAAKVEHQRAFEALRKFNKQYAHLRPRKYSKDVLPIGDDFEEEGFEHPDSSVPRPPRPWEDAASDDVLPVGGEYNDRKEDDGMTEEVKPIGKDGAKIWQPDTPHRERLDAVHDAFTRAGFKWKGAASAGRGEIHHSYAKGKKTAKIIERKNGNHEWVFEPKDMTITGAEDVKPVGDASGSSPDRFEHTPKPVAYKGWTLKPEAASGGKHSWNVHTPKGKKFGWALNLDEAKFMVDMEVKHGKAQDEDVEPIGDSPNCSLCGGPMQDGSCPKCSAEVQPVGDASTNRADIERARELKAQLTHSDDIGERAMELAYRNSVSKPGKPQWTKSDGGKLLSYTEMKAKRAKLIQELRRIAPDEAKQFNE